MSKKLKEGKRGLVSSEEELEEFKRKYSYVVEPKSQPIMTSLTFFGTMRFSTT